jgi:hypothetical protein
VCGCGRLLGSIHRHNRTPGGQVQLGRDLAVGHPLGDEPRADGRVVTMPFTVTAS